MNSAALLNPYIDTIISLVLIYALLSVLASILLEWWNHMVKERGVYLQRAIFRMLDDPLNHNFGYLIYHHPMINGMRRDGNSLPHYLAPEVFSNALVDVVAELATKVRYEQREDGSFNTVRDGYDKPLDHRFVKSVGQLRDSEFKRLLENMIDRHGGTDRLNLDQLKAELQRWFNDHMDRTGGIYKNDQRKKLRLIGLVVALGLNVDSFHLVKVLYQDKDLRDRVVAQAEEVVDRYEEQRYQVLADTTLDVDRMLSMLGLSANDSLGDAAKRELALDSLGMQERRFKEDAEQIVYLARKWQLPIGWSPTVPPLSWKQGKDERFTVLKEFALSERQILRSYEVRGRATCWQILKWIVGILTTALALSWGAPFWFEALSKLVNIRRSGLKPAAKTT